jgi:hypothetical protein
VNFECSRCDGFELLDLHVDLEVEEDEEKEGTEDVEEQVHPQDVDPDVVGIDPKPGKTCVRLRFY